MSSFGALEDEDINMMIKEMVVGLSDYGDNNAEKFLQNTAQIDDQLRQYTLIKTIKESIESDLGGMIYKCEDKNMTEKEAVEKILQSNSFKKLESNIKTRVKDLAHQLKFNLNTEFPLSKTSERLILEDEDDENHDDATTIHEDDGGGVGSGDHNWSSLMGVSSKCADGQFCSYSSPMFLTTESSQQILDNLHPANSVQTRYSALHNLSKSVSLSDLPFSPQWTSLKAYLVDILSVFNGVLWLPAARIVAKGMGRSKEMVEVVLLVLSRHFRMRCDEEKKKVGADEVAEGSVNNARERIVEVSGDACLVVPISLLKALRLLAQFQHTLPLKHSEKVNSRILNSILGILSSNGIASKPSQSISKIAINNGNFNVSSHNFNENVDNLDNLISYSTFTTPFSLFSLVDPDLSWFIKSMHHTSSKCIILDYLKKDNYILKAILRVIIGCCDVEMDQLQEDFNAKCSIFRGGDDTGGESGGNNALTEFDIGDINYDEDSIEDNISKNQRLEKNKVDDSETIDNNLEKKIKLTTIKSLLIRQSIIMLEKVVKSRVGRRLFPVGLVKDKHTVSLENLMVFLVKVWTSSKMVALKNCVGRCLEGWFKSADDKRQYGVLRKVFVFSEVPVLRREGLEVILKKLFLFDVLLSREEEEEEEEEEEDEKTFNEFIQKFKIFSKTFLSYYLTNNNVDNEVFVVEICVKLVIISHKINSKSFHVVGHECELLLNDVRALLIWINKLLSNVVTPTSKDNQPYTFDQMETTLLKIKSDLCDVMVGVIMNRNVSLPLNDVTIKQEFFDHVGKLPLEMINRVSTCLARDVTVCTQLVEVGYVKELFQAAWNSVEFSNLLPFHASIHSSSHASIHYSSDNYPHRFIPPDLPSFDFIVELLTSHESVWCCLFCDPFHSLETFLQQTIFKNTSQEAPSFFSHHQSSFNGLWLLSKLVCCLNTWLMLEAKFEVFESLRKQQQNHVGSNGEVIIDEVSMLRCEIMLRGRVVGGPNERSISADPPILFTTPSIPQVYQVRAFEEKSQVLWCEDIEETVRGVVDGEGMKGIIDVMEKIVEKQFKTQSILSLPFDSHQILIIPSPIAIKMIVEYGSRLGLLGNKPEEQKTNLSLFISHTHSSLIESRLGAFPLSSDHKTAMTTLFGFDWFSGVVFLACCGNADRAYNFLMKLSCLPFSFSMWHYYSRLMSLRGLSTTESTSLHDITKHINARSTPIQAIIHQHLHQHLATHPTLYNSLKMGGLVADRLFDSWKEQCYLGVLDWSFVLKNLLVGVVYGASASISFFVSLLLHVEDDIKTRIHSSASSSSQPTSLSFIQISSSATTTPSITTLFHNTTIFADFKPHSSTFSHNHLLNQLIQEIFEKLMT